MKRGVFHKRLGSTSVAVDLCAIVQVGDQGECGGLAELGSGRGLKVGVLGAGIRLKVSSEALAWYAAR
jgi:hypothetical protein